MYNPTDNVLTRENFCVFITSMSLFKFYYTNMHIIYIYIYIYTIIIITIIHVFILIITMFKNDEYIANIIS